VGDCFVPLRTPLGEPLAEAAVGSPACFDFAVVGLGRFCLMGARHSRLNGVFGTVVLLLVSTFAVSSCGGDQIGRAAICFRDALAKTEVPLAQGPVRRCPSAAAYNLMQRGSGTRFSVTCTHRTGHHYACDVTGPATQSLFRGASAYMLPRGRYRVMYDGQRVSYQPSGG
jgi:hypothetical protein